MTNRIPPQHPDVPDAQWEALARFLAGESTPEEASAIRQLIGRNPGDAGVIVSLDEMISRHVKDSGHAAFAPVARPLDVEGALKRVRQELNIDQAAGPIVARPAPGRNLKPASPATHFRWSRLALAVAAALVVAVGLYSQLTAGSDSGSKPTLVARTFETRIGARDSVLLADGSRVVLAPGSRLEVAAGYGGTSREVVLSGAGHFTVQHDASRPFIVRAGSAVIRDIGTKFVVKTVATAGVMVSVTEGSVSLADSTVRMGPVAELKAGDRGRISDNGTVVLDRGSVTPEEGAWVTGTLVYRDAPMAEVQADLRRWYGVELVIRDSSLLHTVNTSFDNESSALVLKKIAAMLGGELTQHGDTAFIAKLGDRTKR